MLLSPNIHGIQNRNMNIEFKKTLGKNENLPGHYEMVKRNFMARIVGVLGRN